MLIALLGIFIDAPVLTVNVPALTVVLGAVTVPANVEELGPTSSACVVPQKNLCMSVANGVWYLNVDGPIPKP